MLARTMLARRVLPRLSALSASVGQQQPHRAVHAPPRALDAIVKLDLLAREPRERIEEIWKGYHTDKEHTVAAVWEAADYEAFKVAVGTAGSLCLYPVPREGGYFVLISQTAEDGKSCLFTYLEDYRRDPANAVPYLSVAFYSELAELEGAAGAGGGEGSSGSGEADGGSSGIVLVRGDITPGTLELDECHRLLELTKYCYREKLIDVRCFNKGDERFDYEKHIADCLEK
jgi:hypothetical protein